MNCTNWYEQYAFCIWDGGFLPSEAEWNYASAGGTQQREYPWGSTAPGADATLANWGCFRDGVAGCTLADMATPGSVSGGTGRYGQMDLAGNIAESTLDWYESTYENPCTDCSYQPPQCPGAMPYVYGESAGGFCCSFPAVASCGGGNVCALDPSRTQGAPVCASLCPAGTYYYGESAGGFCCNQPAVSDSCGGTACALDPLQTQGNPVCATKMYARAVRGGGFGAAQTSLLASFRYGGITPFLRADYLGARCARTP